MVIKQQQPQLESRNHCRNFLLLFLSPKEMAELSTCNGLKILSKVPPRSNSCINAPNVQPWRKKVFGILAMKSGGPSFNLVRKRCQTCSGQGSIECPGCKGTGKNKKNGNIFERWKCYDCQGFGLKSCPVCGKGGLTPEQRGER
ncbi:uncharacterized protein LOC131236777 isoform X1 [Magnolia sinica]|uniref:uncharacterized protein LOC131236777 isoform X1 n=1 Tax=Magnolia sinica TaxID=86752 RepID=UPI00265A2E66|nr:uncharacterized protein LOC131236777 isoform X1 [Magnolia sinica]